MAVINSEIQKACHTPTAPKILLKTNAVDIVKTVYRSKDIINEAPPILNPSNAPEDITDIEETTNPMLIIRKATLPA